MRSRDGITETGKNAKEHSEYMAQVEGKQIVHISIQTRNTKCEINRQKGLTFVIVVWI